MTADKTATATFQARLRLLSPTEVSPGQQVQPGQFNGAYGANAGSFVKIELLKGGVVTKLTLATLPGSGMEEVVPTTGRFPQTRYQVVTTRLKSPAPPTVLTRISATAFLPSWDLRLRRSLSHLRMGERLGLQAQPRRFDGAIVGIPAPM